LDNYSVQGLFPTPLYSSTINVDDKLKQFLLSQEFKKNKNGIGSITKDTYILNLPDCIELRKQLMNHLSRFTKDILKIVQHDGFYLTNSWVLKTEPGEWVLQHAHAYAMLSGVLYLQTEADAGDIILYRDSSNYNLFLPTILPEFTERNIFNCDHVRIEPKVGNIMIWPSQVYHEVLTNKSNTTRYSLAFNFFIKGKFGDEEHQLVL